MTESNPNGRERTMRVTLMDDSEILIVTDGYRLRNLTYQKGIFAESPTGHLVFIALSEIKMMVEVAE